MALRKGQRPHCLPGLWVAAQGIGAYLQRLLVRHQALRPMQIAGQLGQPPHRQQRQSILHLGLHVHPHHSGRRALQEAQDGEEALRLLERHSGAALRGRGVEDSISLRKRIESSATNMLQPNARPSLSVSVGRVRPRKLPAPGFEVFKVEGTPRVGTCTLSTSSSSQLSGARQPSSTRLGSQNPGRQNPLPVWSRNQPSPKELVATDHPRASPHPCHLQHRPTAAGHPTKNRWHAEPGSGLGEGEASLLQ